MNFLFVGDVCRDFLSFVVVSRFNLGISLRFVFDIVLGFYGIFIFERFFWVLKKYFFLDTLEFISFGYFF